MALSKRQRFEVMKRDGFRCRYCGATHLMQPLEVDHIHPKSKGGKDHPSNLVTACEPCNAGKSAVSLLTVATPDATSLPNLEETMKLREFAMSVAMRCPVRCEMDPLIHEWFNDFLATSDRVGDDDWMAAMYMVQASRDLDFSKLTSLEQRDALRDHCAQSPCFTEYMPDLMRRWGR